MHYVLQAPAAPRKTIFIIPPSRHCTVHYITILHLTTLVRVNRKTRLSGLQRIRSVIDVAFKRLHPAYPECMSGIYLCVPGHREPDSFVACKLLGSKYIERGERRFKIVYHV